LLQGCFCMENLEISMIRVRAGPASVRPRTPLIRTAVNPYRPIDLKPVRNHDDRGGLD